MTEWIITDKPKPYGTGAEIGRVTGDRRHDAWVQAQALYGVIDGKVLMMRADRSHAGNMAADLVESLEISRLEDLA